MEAVLYVAENGGRTQAGPVADAAIRTPIEKVHLDECIRVTEQLAAFADAEGAVTMHALTSSSTMANCVYAVAVCTFFS